MTLVLVLGTGGEGNHEDAENVVIGSLDVDDCLDERVPLLDQAAELVGGVAQS